MPISKSRQICVKYTIYSAQGVYSSAQGVYSSAQGVYSSAQGVYSSAQGVYSFTAVSLFRIPLNYFRIE